MTCIQALYVNGILTEYSEAKEQAHWIADEANIPTELIFNHSTSWDESSQRLYALAKSIWGFLSENHDTRADGLLHYEANEERIEEAKKYVIETLKEKTVSVLSTSDEASVLWILHSQGAEIGKRALEELSGYAQQIHVIALGGKINVPKKLAKTVHNFAFADDMTSHAAKFWYSGTDDLYETTYLQDGFLIRHSFESYMKSEEVRKVIGSFGLK